MFGIKPVKVRSLSGNTKYGVAGRDLKELLQKSCRLFQLPVSGAQFCLYDDGTTVTQEFFQTLPENTELVLLSGEQTWAGVFSDVSQLLNTDRHAEGLIQAAKQLLGGEKSFKRRKILTDLLQNLEDRSELESREEDQDWFSGVDSRFKTKSAYMKYNCASRIRSYLKEVDLATKSINKARVREEYSRSCKFLAERLKGDSYNGSYFDRTAEEPHRLCTQQGWFTCQGSFDQKTCQQLHSINPYSSRESRIIFSTWNLDHRIEKKRTVIPMLLEVLETHKSSAVNLNYFYQLLFTTQNLKLVHIVCHKKGGHNLSCDTSMAVKASSHARKRKKEVPAKKRRVL
ncbi:DNA fragmentation factor subunit beta [Oryzias melastigma]|uniref:DNA fragmentation factor subunit beta n=1 Tax=Oryzias melastigma TaxID=30732 RepID=A0A3B3CCN6_ORYME|nr:DNA fragmentation factor subunit beta [Oryzias melastigma]